MQTKQPMKQSTTTSSEIVSSSTGGRMIVPGRGADAALETRPGVPMEMEPPRPMGNAHWTEPDLQEPRVPVLMHTGRDELTPVFGTTVPPRGLSGVLRRLAYKIPDYRAKHWMLLMFADKVDVKESALRRLVTNPLTWAVGALAVGVIYARRK